MKSSLSDKFIEKFSTIPEFFVKAPGRINIIGEHTDYNDGFVLPAAIDKHILFAISESEENDHSFYSLDFDSSIQLPIEIEVVSHKDAWVKYIESTMVQLKLRSYVSKPIKCAFVGNIPLGGGMSSSAALCCGLLFSLNEINEWSLTRKQMAMIAQATEHGIGMNCGIMDQFISLFGRKNEVMLLDCRTLNTQYFELDLGDYRVCLINSMQKHEFSTDSEYNDRRASCERVVAKIKESDQNVLALRDINLKQLSRIESEVEATDYKRSLYVIEENNRVHEMAKALKTGDTDRIGKILKDAHSGMKNLYEITTPEIDFMVNFVNDADGALGARMMGGGFGGCTINIIHKDHLEKITKELYDAYKSAFGRNLEVYHLSIEDGVNVV
jgi:galactokinase